MSWFKPKLNISEGKKYDVSEMSSDGVTQEEAVKKNKKLIEIFKAFNFNGGEKLEDIELAAAMDAFEKMDKQFGNKDGKLSKSELEKGAAWLNKEFGLEGDKAIDRKDLKEFIKNIEKATRKDEKVSTNDVIETWTAEQKKLAEAKSAASAPPVEPDPPAKEEDKPQTKQPPELNSYTVQEGESYTDLIVRSLKAQGVENPTKEQIKEAKEKFKENNPDTVRKAKNGVEFLLVGAKVKLEGKLEDKNNSAEQIKKYNEKYTAPPADDTSKKVKTSPQKEKPDKEIPKTKPEAAKALGLRETFATKSQGIYYDEKNKTHYQWNEETEQFDAMDKSISMVDKEGYTYDDQGKLNNWQLKKDGTSVLTKEDGSTRQEIQDENGKLTKIISRDKNGKITDINDKLSFDADGNLINRRLIEYNSDGKVSGILNYSLAEDGYFNVVIRDAKGKKLRTEKYKGTIKDGYTGKTPVSVTDDALISEYKNELVGTYSRLKVCSDERPHVTGNQVNSVHPYLYLSTGDKVIVLKDDKGNITQIGVSLKGDKDDKYDVIYHKDNTVEVQKDGEGEYQKIRNGTDFNKIMKIIGPMFNK